jgi:Phytanoyl-CoA dioxygenase (PhyH)
MLLEFEASPHLNFVRIKYWQGGLACWPVGFVREIPLISTEETVMAEVARDYALDTISVRDMRKELDRHGYILLRNAVPRDRVAQYEEALDTIYRRYEAQPDDFARFNPDQVAVVKQGDVAPPIFTGLSGLTLEGYFEIPKLNSFLDRVFVFGIRSATLHTFMSVSAKPGMSTTGIPLHTDGIIQGNAAPITLWSPLHPCGLTAPGLRVVSASKEAVWAYLRRHFPKKKIPGWSSMTEWNDTSAFKIETITGEFGPPWAPAMNAGDIMIFTNWTIHSSYVTPDMAGRRSAAILRWRGWQRWRWLG